MSKKTITIKVTGTTEEVNLLTDYFPVEHIEWMTGRMPNNDDVEKCHRFIYLDKQMIEDVVLDKFQPKAEEGAK